MGIPPFRCPRARAADDIDHVLGRQGPPSRARWPDDRDSNPFVRFRSLLHASGLARDAGMSDRDLVTLIRELDAAVAGVDGHGFTETPLVRATGLEQELDLGGGQLWVKDETGNVAGSHKARHLMGIAIGLAVAQRSGLWAALNPGAPLAISSCGNAALAAAVVARAAGRRLRVAIPSWADPVVVARLEALGATLEVCARSPTSPPGDPCHHRLREDVAAGALPFTCQGNENGLTIDGGMTLGWELVDQLREHSLSLDRLVVQVGGGALASACVQSLRWARELGVIERLPVIHAVQTKSAHPLEGAWRLVAERAASGVQGSEPAPPQSDAPALAAWLHVHASSTDIDAALAHAASHRSEYMRPVTEPPRSVATGILDDETYDWREVVRGMLETGGWPLTVEEETLIRARNRGSEATGIAVDATGTAGLAGVYALSSAGVLGLTETVAVLFTGLRRRSASG